MNVRENVQLHSGDLTKYIYKILRNVCKCFVSLITLKAAYFSRYVQRRSGRSNIYTSTAQQNIFSNPIFQNHGFMVFYKKLIYHQY